MKLLIDNTDPERIETYKQIAISALNKAKGELLIAITENEQPNENEDIQAYKQEIYNYCREIEDSELLFGAILSEIRRTLRDDNIYKSVLRKGKIKVKTASEYISKYESCVRAYNHGINELTMEREKRRGDKEANIKIYDTDRESDSVYIHIFYDNQADIPRLFESAMKQYNHRKEVLNSIENKIVDIFNPRTA